MPRSFRIGFTYPHDGAKEQVSTYYCRDMWISAIGYLCWTSRCQELEKLTTSLRVGNEKTLQYLQELNALFPTTRIWVEEKVDNIEVSMYSVLRTSWIIHAQGKHSILVHYWLILVDRILCTAGSTVFAPNTIYALMSWSTVRRDCWDRGVVDKQQAMRYWNGMQRKTKLYPDGFKPNNKTIVDLRTAPIRMRRLTSWVGYHTTERNMGRDIC